MLNSKRALVALMCVVFLVGICAAANAVEMTLAGIKLGSPATGVLKKYGNPTRVTASDIVAVMEDPAQNQQSNNQPSNLPPGYPTPGQMPNQPGQMPNQQQTIEIQTEPQVTWTYDLPDGTTLEFIISQNGRVVQITVGGDKPFKQSVTSKGIKLGSLYKDVVLKYGYPESQQEIGRFLQTSYADKHRIVFLFCGPEIGQVKKLVGITIALKAEK